jgi:hypothetical protein
MFLVTPIEVDVAEALDGASLQREFLTSTGMVLDVEVIQFPLFEVMIIPTVSFREFVLQVSFGDVLHGVSFSISIAIIPRMAIYYKQIRGNPLP